MTAPRAAGWLLACPALLAAATAAADALSPFYVGDPSQWGHVVEFVEPRYPKRAAAQRLAGHVDVSGRVSAEGVLEQVTYSPDRRASVAFINALRHAVPQWRFQPPLGRDCQPSGERVVNRVWFQVEEGTPRVGVTVAPGPARRDRPAILPLERVEPRPEAYDARRAPRFAFTRIQVDAAGQVVSVEPRLHARRGTAGLREAEHEVIRAVTQWRFPPAPGAAGNRFVCAALRLR